MHAFIKFEGYLGDKEKKLSVSNIYYYAFKINK
jgi:hypothetical protein